MEIKLKGFGPSINVKNQWGRQGEKNKSSKKRDIWDDGIDKRLRAQKQNYFFESS